MSPPDDQASSGDEGSAGQRTPGESSFEEDVSSALSDNQEDPGTAADDLSGSEEGTADGESSPAGQFVERPSPLSDRIALEKYLPSGNERLDYEVGFLWFDRLADGALLLERLEGEGHYRATLEVQTRGMAALFTRNRRERYESHMQLGDDGFFHSRSFVTRRFKGKGEDMTDRGKALFFDHKAGKVVYQRSKNGVLTDENRLELPTTGEVYDFLCAYWNLRLGMFGPLRPGTRLVLPSYSFKGASDIVVEVLGEEERSRVKDFPEGGVLCRLYLDEELFETGGGKLYVWFNDARQPGKGIVVDVLGLGDVRGTMMKASSYDAPEIPLDVIEKPIHIKKAN